MTVLLSLVFYLISVFYFRSIMGLVRVDAQMWIKVILVTMFCWGPFQLIETVRKRLFPTISDKIMKVAVDGNKDRPDSDFGGLGDSRIADTDPFTFSGSGMSGGLVGKGKKGSLELESGIGISSTDNDDEDEEELQM